MARLEYVRLLSALYVATFAIRTSFGIGVATFAKYVEAGDFVYGLVVAASPLLEIVTVLWVGVTIDRYGRRTFLLAGLGVGGLGLFLTAFTQNVLLLGVLNAIHGFSAGLILVSSLALLADYARPDRRGREMGVFDFVNLFGWVVGYALGLTFLDLFAANLGTTFLVSGAIALAALAYGFWNVHEPQRDRYTTRSIDWAGLKQALTQKRIAYLTAPWFAVFLLASSLLAFFPRALGAPVEAAAESAAAGAAQAVLSGSQGLWILVGGGAVFLATQVLFGKLSDRYGRIPLMFLGACGFFLATLTVALVVLLFPHGRSELPVVALQAAAPLLAPLAFFALAFGPSALAALADAASERAHGTTMSIYSLVVSAGWFVGPPVVGGLSELTGVSGVSLFFLAAGATMPVFVFLLHREHRRTGAPQAHSPATADGGA